MKSPLVRVDLGALLRLGSEVLTSAAVVLGGVFVGWFVHASEVLTGEVTGTHHRDHVG